MALLCQWNLLHVISLSTGQTSPHGEARDFCFSHGSITLEVGLVFGCSAQTSSLPLADPTSYPSYPSGLTPSWLRY
ncbi:hypothetical protein LINGRAHAP2_LOCUS1511 [Linum grandiflorum]